MNSPQTKSNPEERVLTLLHLLGEEVAEEVLTRLEPQVTSSLRNRLKTFEEHLPSVKVQRQVIEEFERFFKFAVASSPRLRLHAPDDEEGDHEEDTAPVYTLSGDPLVDLEKMNLYQLSAALNEEQPRTVALLLKVLSTRRVAQLLPQLTESHRESVVREMSRDPRTSETVLRKIATTTVEKASRLPAEPPKKDDPVQRLVEVLRATDKSKRRQILRAIEDQDPEKASLINQALYQFDDLLAFEDHKVQQLLSRVDSSTLSTALFKVDEKIVAKIMSNLSKRARSTLQEELSFKKNVPLNQIKAAQLVVVQAMAEVDQDQE